MAFAIHLNKKFVMQKNSTLFQFFHWYYPDDGSLWDHCRQQAEHLASLGVTHVWLPPAYKSANGTAEPGYAVYDLFDLGEFDQKGTVRTKYGTRDQYISCVKALQQAGIQAIADVVLNHKQGADEQEHLMAHRVNSENRNEISPEATGIDAFTKFTFPGRKGKYSDYIWNHDSFKAVSVGRENEYQIYLLEHQNGQDGWEEMIEGEKGNFDYLMGSDIAFNREFVRNELEALDQMVYRNHRCRRIPLRCSKAYHRKILQRVHSLYQGCIRKGFFLYRGILEP